MAKTSKQVGGTGNMAKKERTWKRERMTTFVATENLSFLRALSDTTGVPVGRIVDQALDGFFKDIKWRETSATPPIDKKHFEDGAQQLKSS